MVVFIARLKSTAIPASVVQYIINESKELLESVASQVEQKIYQMLTGMNKWHKSD